MMIPRIAVASFLSLLLAGLAWAIPSVEPLDRALDRADLVVVGKRGKLTPIEGTHQATGEIPVAQVLKGPADLKTVTLQTVAPGQQVVGPVIRHEGDEGIWILDKHAAAGGTGRYVAIGPSNLQPLTALDEVKRILKEQGTLAQPPASQPAPATQPVDGKAVAELIRLLGDDAFAVREDATRKLIAMGTAIHPVLRAKLQEPTLAPEIAARIRTIVDPTVEVRLRISNQSQRLRAADIRVTIDDKEIVAKVLDVGMGHNFERIVTPLTEGEHTLTVESKAGTVKQEIRIRISKEKRWIDINFWSPPSKFTIEVCDNDRPTL